MLSYNHVFNNNVDYPYHIHSIASDSTSVSINLNHVFLGYFKPTAGSTYVFQKYYSIDSIFDLLVVGSRQSYDRKKEASYFKESTARYIRNTANKYLVRDLITNKYYWSSSERSRFFFNPEYFSSEVLWNLTVGYVPSGWVTIDLWNEQTAKDLFLTQTYVTTNDWVGQQEIADVDPITVDYFGNSLTGEVLNISVDYFITELQDLKNGDLIEINNGNESITVVVQNSETTIANYNRNTKTYRPLVHVPIDFINPNIKYLYTTSLNVGESKNISLTLHGLDINFYIKRI